VEPVFLQGPFPKDALTHELIEHDDCGGVSKRYPVHPVEESHRKRPLAELAGGNHLVVDQIRRHARQGQIAALLSNDLVPRSKRDAVGEPFDGHRIAVAHMRGDRRAHVNKL
jgi:hypothetical protein